MEDYYQNKTQKRKDLLNGVLHNLIVGVIVASLYFFILIFLGDPMESNTFGKVFRIAIVGLGVIGVFIYEFIVIRKHLKGRRYIAIGMIIAIVLPLLAFGACSPWIIGVDMR